MSRALGLLFIVVIPIVIMMIYAGSHWTINFDAIDWQARFRDAPTPLVFIGLLLLPLAGIPLSLLLAVLGVVLPISLGLALTVVCLIFHHLLVLGLCKTRGCDWVKSVLVKRNLLSSHRLDRNLSDNIFFTLVVTWFPGVSYIFKLFFLAMAGMPIKTFFVVSLIAQLVTALPYLILGKFAADGHFIWLGIGVFVLTVLSWMIKKRFAQNSSLGQEPL